MKNIEEHIECFRSKLEYVKMCGDFNKGDRDYYEALSFAISVLEKLKEEKIEEVLSLLQLTWDVQMYNHTTKKRWTEHAKVSLKGKEFAGRLSQSITAYLIGEKGTQ